MNPMIGKARRFWLLFVLLLAGCVAQPVIDSKGFAPPKSAVVVDVPPMNVAAVVGVIVPWAPGFPWFHFSEKADYYYAAGSPQGPTLPDHQQAVSAQAQAYVANMQNPPSPVVGGVAAGAGALVGVFIQRSAEETFKKSQNFGAEVLKRHPGFDLRADFMAALSSELKARGVAVTVSSEGAGSAPRLRWPAVDESKNKYPSGSADSFPAVDADVLLQVSPLAFYNAPGPLNAYKRNVSVGVAMYNGRTKQFLGRQTVWFSAPDVRFEYSRYDDLVADLPAAAPALRQALVSLAPKVADIVSGKPVR